MPVGEGRLWWSSPRLDFGRRVAWRGSPTWRWSSGRTAMAAAVWARISAGERHKRAQRGAVEVEGKVDRGSGGSMREERRRSDERRPARRALLASARRALRKEKGGLGRDGKLRGIRERRRAASGRDCRRVEARRRPQSPVWRRASTGEALESTVIAFRDFDSILVN